LGHSERGAAILAAAIVIGNLNILFLLGFFEASPDPATIWAYWIPRIVHDVISVWSIVFWAWTVFDAYTLKGKE